MKKFLLFLCFTFAFANDLNEILEQKLIRIGINENTPPFSFKNKQGEFLGFEVEMAEELAEELSPELKIEFIYLDKFDRIQALEDNRVDLVISTFTITKERSERIDFSAPYFLVNTGVLSKKNDAFRSMNDLKNKRLAIIPSSTTFKNLKNNDYDLIFCQHSKECFEKLENDEADAFISDDMVLFVYVNKNYNYEVAIKRVGKGEFLAVGLAKNNEELLEKINAILVKMHLNKKFKKIYNRTIAPLYNESITSSEFLLDDFYKNVRMTDEIE